MRTVSLLGLLVVLTAGAAFWMGRLSATSTAPNDAQPWVRNSSPLEHPLPTVVVRPVRRDAVKDESFPDPIRPALREEPVELHGTSKGASSLEAAGAGVARPAGEVTEPQAVAKRERPQRLGRSVGPDGVRFEPVRHTTSTAQAIP
jgi:hypothetical protein